MTCIVALVHEDRVWMGGDAYDEGAHGMVLATPKVAKRGGYLIGAAGCARVCSVLMVLPKLPKYEGGDVERFAVKEVVPALRRTLRREGCVQPDKDDGRESISADVLLGFAGTVVVVSSSFAVSVPACGYTAVGSGDGVALGYLHATHGPPEARVHGALRAAEAHAVGVRGPFTVRRV